MKKNNTAEKTALDAKKIAKALKEGTEKTLQDIVSESISKMIMEDEDEDLEKDDNLEDDSYDVEDVETDEEPKMDDEPEEEGGEEADTEDSEDSEESDEEGADDEWSDLEKYKVGDNDYDFTGVDGDEILNVYNRLDDDDQIFVKKEGDGTYSFKDDETGAEFVIELDPEALDANADAEADDDVDLNLDLDDEEGDADGDIDIDIDLDGEEGGEDGDIELDLNDDDDDETLNEGNLEYTDSYQDDVFDKKFNMNEPADSKTTYSMDGGAPKGAEKPWAGKGDSKPFKTKVDECGPTNEEDANLEEAGYELRKASQTTSKTETGEHDTYMAHPTTRNVSKNGVPTRGTATNLDESVKKIVNKARQIQEENKKYQNYIKDIKTSLYEAAVLNVNLGKLVSILVNETTTKAEKKSICERFNNVKTIAEGDALYNTIKSELNENKKTAPVLEKQMSAEGTKTLNETTIYRNGNEDNPSLNLMERMDNLYKR